MEGLGSRVRQVREERGLSQVDFGKPAGLTRDAVSRLERDVAKTVVPGDLVSLAATYQLALVWLLTGEGNPYIDNVEEPTADGADGRGSDRAPISAHPRPSAVDSISVGDLLGITAERARDTITQQATAIELLKRLLDEKDVHRVDVHPSFRLVARQRDLEQGEGSHWAEQYVAVPLMTDAAAAGNPRMIDDEAIDGYCLVYASWVKDLETTRCVRVRGDSMAPLLPDGAIVGLDLAARDPRQLDGRIVAARIEDGVTIKWLELGDGVILLRPENREHKTLCLHPGPDDAPIIGRVTWWWAHSP